MMMEKSFEYLKEMMATDLAEMLVGDYQMSALQALDTLYSSETYLKLCNADTGLYFQSPKYVYSYLKHELETGKIG